MKLHILMVLYGLESHAKDGRCRLPRNEDIRRLVGKLVEKQTLKVWCFPMWHHRAPGLYLQRRNRLLQCFYRLLLEACCTGLTRESQDHVFLDTIKSEKVIIKKAKDFNKELN